MEQPAATANSEESFSAVLAKLTQGLSQSSSSAGGGATTTSTGVSSAVSVYDNIII